MTASTHYRLLLLFGLPMAALTVGLGYFVGQADFYPLLAFYFLFFAGYLFLLTRPFSTGQVRHWLWVAIGLRALLLFSEPGWSDDVFRYLWDGQLWVQGINPFEQLPGYYLEPGHAVPGLTEELFHRLNSPNYFTIYPPVAQLTFAVAAWASPGNMAGSILIMKLFLLACEAGSLLLLPRLLQALNLPVRRALIYALNPLIILEIVGNLHYEGAMVFFLLLALWWLVRERTAGSAAAMALSISSKLLPLLFLPFLIRRLGWRRSIGYFAILGAGLLLLFLPLFGEFFLHHFGQSLDLYFRKFEFNGSFYYLARWWGYQQVGYNRIADIGPRLAAMTFAGITMLALYERDRSWAGLPALWLFSICLYLFFTTTIHPWYVTLPVVLCLFTRFRFPVLWSGLIVLTYINYSYTPYRENLWVVALEYTAVLGWLLWEWRRPGGRDAG